MLGGLFCIQATRGLRVCERVTCRVPLPRRPWRLVYCYCVGFFFRRRSRSSLILLLQKLTDLLAWARLWLLLGRHQLQVTQRESLCFDDMRAGADAVGGVWDIDGLVSSRRA